MRKVLIALLTVLALFGGWVVWVRCWYESVRPAGPMLADHLAQRPSSEERRVVEANGNEHLAMFGSIQEFPRFPSGPPVYVFDPAGQMVDWTADVGDDSAFNSRWPGLYSGREITPEEVAAWPCASR